MIGEFEKNLINLSNHQIYTKIKNMITRDFLNNRDSEYLLGKYYNEATLRSDTLYQDALDDAFKVIESLRQAEFDSNVNSYMRASYLGDEDKSSTMNEIINDSGFDLSSEKIGSYNLEELTGIEFGNLIISSVSGDSMINAGIYDGDLIFADTKAEISNGDIIIASVNDALFVKRIINDNNSLILASENPKYPPVKIAEDMKFSVIGKVVNVLHTLNK